MILHACAVTYQQVKAVSADSGKQQESADFSRDMVVTTQSPNQTGMVGTRGP